jgi:hypothetical protein
MTRFGKQSLAAASLLCCAALLLGAGVRLASADEPKPVDLTELRDAIQLATKRGENVAEVRKAFDALDKLLSTGWAPKDGRSDPPAELTALRTAVEEAARKGENVEDIRKQLEGVEKAMIGRTLTAPKPMPPTEPAQPNPARPRLPRPIQPLPLPVPPGGDFPLPDLLPGVGIDPAAIQKAQEQMVKAMEQLIQNPNDPDAKKLLEEARESLLKAMMGGRGGIAPGLVLPDLGRVPDFGGIRGPQRFRLGVRMERVPELTAEQLGLEAGRGIAITDVIAGSAAEKAGFKIHDIVLEFAGKPVSENPEDFTRLVESVKAGEKVDAVVLRKGKKVELKGIELPEKAQVIGPADLPPGVPPFPFPPQVPNGGRPGLPPKGGDPDKPGPGKPLPVID